MIRRNAGRDGFIMKFILALFLFPGKEGQNVTGKGFYGYWLLFPHSSVFADGRGFFQLEVRDEIVAAGNIFDHGALLSARWRGHCNIFPPGAQGWHLCLRRKS